MPYILAIIIALIAFLDPYVPLTYKSFLYALSLSIKSFIVFLLPAIIFALLFKTVAKLGSGATKLILFLLGAVCCSNFLSTLISYQIGSAIYKANLSLSLPLASQELVPAWTFALPKWIANDHAMFAGLILGIFCSFIRPKLASQLADIFDKVVNRLLKVIVAIIPLFIAGFMVKLVHDKVLQNMIHEYALIMSLVALSVFSYILFIYSVANSFRLKPFMESLRNMFPAAITAFGSMSSAATLPLTILATEKNTQDPPLTRLVIPTTVNIHLMGDCFAIPIFAFAILKNFNLVEPEFLSYLIFALYFVLAKFSVAAIPGGGILVMLPILESHLGFTGEMSSLITALYILFDPIITCANVMGNGGFAQLLSRLKKRFYKQELSSLTR